MSDKPTRDDVQALLERWEWAIKPTVANRDDAKRLARAYLAQLDELSALQSQLDAVIKQWMNS